MIKIYIEGQPIYSLNIPKLKKRIKEFLKKKGIVSNTILSVSLVGEKEMRRLGERYLKSPKIHSVLSFSFLEKKSDFVYPPGFSNYIGEIVICYPKAVKEAESEKRLIDEKIFDLVEHGITHLLA